MLSVEGVWCSQGVPPARGGDVAREGRCLVAAVAPAGIRAATSNQRGETLHRCSLQCCPFISSCLLHEGVE